MEQSKNEVCLIRIVFPVASDEQALNIKNQIDNSIKDIEGARSEFSLKTAHGLLPTPMSPANWQPPNKNDLQS